MKNSEKLNKLNPQIYAGLNRIKDFLEKEKIEFEIKDTEIILFSVQDFSKTGINIEDIIYKLDFNKVDIFQILGLYKSIITIQFNENIEEIKIIHNNNFIERLKNKIIKILG